MPLYDAVEDLTFDDRESRARAARSAAEAPHPQDDGLPPARVGRGGRRRGRHLRGGAPPGRRASRPDGRPHDRLVLEARGRGQPGYRIWGLESAALDLALRQAGSSLADAVEREPRPVTFVVSQSAVQRAARALSRDPVQARCERQVDGRGRRRARRDRGGRRRRLQGALRRRLGRCDSVGRAVQPCCSRVPGGLARGRAHQRRDAAVLEPHRERLTWDFPIHSVEDVEALEWPPRCLNSKPSRFGSVQGASSTSTTTVPRTGSRSTAAASSSSGRAAGQIQHLASLFHADAPNDVAPKEYNDGGPRPGLPQSPLPPAASEPGFR